jgi:hypothetical protein
MKKKERKPRIKTTDWRQLPIETWTATTFKEYLVEQHQLKFDLPYQVNNWKMHQRMIKNLYEKHGQEVVKEFIDICFSRLRPKAPYYNLNFVYLYSYYRDMYLNQAVVNVRKRKHAMNNIQSKNDELWF